MKIVQRLVINTCWLLTICFVLAIILLAFGFFYVKYKLPDVAVLENVHLQVPMQVFTADGKLIGEFGEKRRMPVDIEEVPKLLQNAIVAVEDQRFYEHRGVDPIGLMRAVRELIMTGKKRQGASTITMQVARNFFLSREKTYERKINEIFLALMIDFKFDKEKILELYLNKIYLGNQSYGVAAAAQVYYGKQLSELTLAEIAMIAGLAQAPSSNNPLVNSEKSVARRNHVLRRMLDNEHITQAEYDKAIQAPNTATFHRKVLEAKAPYIAEMTRQAMYRKYGDAAYTEGFKVYTTVDSATQTAARKALQDNLLAYERRHPQRYRLPKENLGKYSEESKSTWLKKLKRKADIGPLQHAAIIDYEAQTPRALLSNGEIVTVATSGLGWTGRRLHDIFKPGSVIRIMQKADGSWHLRQPPLVEGALVSLNPQDGRMLAIVGGFDFTKSKFNRAIQGELQPGSSFKPFIYSAALEQGYSMASMVNDAPIVVRIPGQKPWRPQNASRRFYGPTRLRNGLTYSRNLVSIRLLDQIGVNYAIDYATRFGFDKSRLPVSLTLALGTAQVTPLEMARAYAVFANGGYLINPYFIERITDNEDNIIYQAKPKLACSACNDIDALITKIPSPERLAPQVISPQNAYIMTSVLQDVIRRGTGRRALALKRSDLAGKTGSTNDKLDGWFSGFNADVVTSVWFGFDQPRSLHEYGGQSALPAWIDYMGAYLKDKPEQTIPEPPGLIYVRIDPNTGQRAPSGARYGIFEVFREQNLPETDFYYDYMYEQNANTNANRNVRQAATPPAQNYNQSEQPLF
jgi:penicillin-binding protein 1A